MLERRRRRGDRRPSPGRGDPAHGLGEVVGEALERLDRLREPEHEHQRRVGGQLDVDVVGWRAARRRPRSRCSRCRGRRSRSAADPSPRSPGRPTMSSPTTAAARNRVDRRAGRGPTRRSCGPAAPRRGRRAGAGRCPARPSAASSGWSSAPAARSARPRRRRSGSSSRHVQHRRLGQAADDLVRRGEHRVGAQRAAATRAAPGESRSASPRRSRRPAPRRRRARPRRSPRMSAAIP